MRDFDSDDFPEDDKIEISDLDIPDKDAQSSLVYRIVKRVREIHLSPRTRIILFTVILLMGGSTFAYLTTSSLRPKQTLVTYGVLQALSTSVTFSTTTLSITNGIAYIGTPDGTISARRASDGTLLWQSKGSIPLSQPIMMNDTIYVASQNSQGSHVDAFRASDGTLQWSYQTQPLGSQSFMVADGTVYIHTQSGMLYALRASDGKLLWHLTVNLSDPLETLLFTSNGITAVRVNTYTVYLLRTQDGSQLLRYLVNNNGSWQPVIERGVAYIYENESSVQAYRLSDRKLLWQYTSTSGAAWSFIVQNGVFYVNTGDGSLEALNMQNGEQIWQFKTSDGISEWRPAGKFILFTSLNGLMEALNARDGSFLWRFRRSSYSNIFWFSDIKDGLLHVIVDTPDTAFYTLQVNNGKMVGHQSLNKFNENDMPTVINNVLYTLQSNGSIDAWSSSDGKHLWNYQPNNFVLWNMSGDRGLLYLQQVDGTLVFLRTQDGKVAWHYP